MDLPEKLKSLDLELIGSGKQGHVYHIFDKLCVKVYKKEKYFKRELKTLKLGQDSPFFPRLYEWGDYYIIREFIQGTSLDKYLKSYPLTRKLSKQIISLYQDLEKLGFRRMDVRLPHLFLTPDSRLKLIDPTNMLRHKRKYPRKMLSGLAKLGWKEDFFDHLQAIDPDFYQYWHKKSS